MNIRVLVVDDTIMYRKIVSDILKGLPGVEVVGTANNGKIALSRIKSLKPDLITLDVEMPVMNGLETLVAIQQQGFEVECLMLSSVTERGSEVTMKALELGAFDFILKPDKDSPEENYRYIEEELSRRLKVFVQQRQLRRLLRHRKTRKPAAVTTRQRPEEARQVLQRSKAAGARKEKSAVVAIGISTGGPNALTAMLPRLPADLGVPVLIVQHMPPVFTRSLAASLDKKCSLAVKEAVNGEVVQHNTVYIAPGGSQMKIASGADLHHKIIRITDDPPENNCKPSVDYLFRSVAREYGSKATGVIMTGMGADGKLGLQVMKSAGAVSVAQDADTCVVYGMPKAVAEAGLVDVVASLDRIAAEIVKTVQ
ncbi:MAG: chemotaxis response regulator protein-glutamate methylesterase [Deltaproteobacteria bacterium]|nr:chemotaxis response regulator protein-glutamate methylesterase [Deltaproteobacteria bacterium]